MNKENHNRSHDLHIVDYISYDGGQELQRMYTTILELYHEISNNIYLYLNEKEIIAIADMIDLLYIAQEKAPGNNNSLQIFQCFDIDYSTRRGSKPLEMALSTLKLIDRAIVEKEIRYPERYSELSEFCRRLIKIAYNAKPSLPKKQILTEAPKAKIPFPNN